MGQMTGNSINRGLAAVPGQERSIRRRARPRRRSTSAPASRGNGKEYVAPRGSKSACRAQSRSGTSGRLGSGRRGGGPPRPPAVVPFEFQVSPARRQVLLAAALADRRALGQAACGRHRLAGRDLRGLLRRAVVAARRRPDQSRHRDALACGRDRGQYRPRQHRRGRRHADRARRAHPDRGPHPRHHRARPRPCDRRQRAEGRSQAVRRRASDGTSARRKPQPRRCRTRGPNHAGRLCHGLRRRHRQAAGDRRRLEARCRPGAGSPAPGARARPARTAPDDAAERIARRPRLARQPQPDRARRPEPQRDRSEERQSGRRRPAARQQMDLREYQPQPAPAERRRRGAQPWRRGRPPVVAAV